jgi:hypothetical protein
VRGRLSAVAASAIGYGGQDFGEISRVAVLESWQAGCWSTGVLEYCPLSELHPASAGLEMLSGHTA